MSFSIDTAFVNQYRANVELIYQQRGSRLRGTVSQVTQNAEFAYYEQLGKAAAAQITTRHGDTPLMDITHSRRRLQCVSWNWATLVDTVDKLQMIIDPTSDYATSAAFELGRQVDASIIAAATGTAYTGKSGGTSTAYDTNYQIAANYVESGAAANSNLTIGKLRQARYLLDANEAVMDGEPIYAIVSASQIKSLLRSTEVTSEDYNSVKALVNGQVDTFMGLKFIRTELLSTTGTLASPGTRTCLVYPQSAIKLGMAEDITVKMDVRADKNYSTQVYAESRFGAVRMWEPKVISVLCDETK